MTIDRESWERRWAAAPELRPTWGQYSLRFSDHGLELVEVDEHGELHGVIVPQIAADLILARAVTWLVEQGRGESNVRLSVTRGGIFDAGISDPEKGGYTYYGGKSLLDALGAAIDSVLEARKEKP